MVIVASFYTDSEGHCILHKSHKSHKEPRSSLLIRVQSAPCTTRTINCVSRLTTRKQQLCSISSVIFTFGVRIFHCAFPDFRCRLASIFTFDDCRIRSSVIRCISLNHTTLYLQVDDGFMVVISLGTGTSWCLLLYLFRNLSTMSVSPVAYCRLSVMNLDQLSKHKLRWLILS